MKSYIEGGIYGAIFIAYTVIVFESGKEVGAFEGSTNTMIAMTPTLNSPLSAEYNTEMHKKQVEFDHLVEEVQMREIDRRIKELKNKLSKPE